MFLARIRHQKSVDELLRLAEGRRLSAVEMSFLASHAAKLRRTGARFTPVEDRTLAEHIEHTLNNGSSSQLSISAVDSP
jgi:hypothetical protein